MNEYIFAGIAMVFWGIAPVWGKLGLCELQPLAALTIRSIIITIILVVVVTIRGQWGLVAGVSAKNIGFIGLEGICAALLGQLAYYYALRLGEVSRVSPIVSAFPLVALMLGILILGEKLTIYKIVAALLIVIGIVLMRY
ncbi:EamA family transporter [Sporomusa acidovorans]|uniref:EamA domain-containing protein n=1 Tax=Sporomusa acidovorans (strain ATCC 49682 / DSM 3132 / Mol) TaxID=1123286 RepID=A0ABZ3J1M8_SPOA4|nr:EamA family transporter [Sporomusa acidovorans]OZC23202.1 EamA-like transporter family protein [Sporomusa acidovorans DSM 3132]SDE97544.1 transporter family protein [Sporomusa acidovorans]